MDELLANVDEMKLADAIIPYWAFQQISIQVKDKLKLALFWQACLRHAPFFASQLSAMVCETKATKYFTVILRIWFASAKRGLKSASNSSQHMQACHRINGSDSTPVRPLDVHKWLMQLTCWRVSFSPVTLRREWATAKGDGSFRLGKARILKYLANCHNVKILRKDSGRSQSTWYGRHISTYAHMYHALSRISRVISHPY